MRYREPFSLFAREVPSGASVFYYYTYTPDGKRTTARSTGQTSITQARLHCMKLWRENKLVPEVVEKKIPTLKEFSATFWVHGQSDFLKYKEQRGYIISKAHARNQQRYIELYIEPALGKRRLDEITAPMVETWFLSLKDAGKSHQTCNHMLSNLRTILAEAMRRGIVTANPVDAIKPLSKDSKTRGILTTEEVKELLVRVGCSTLWPTVQVYLANLLAATTGMRMGEIQALRWADLSPMPMPDRIIVRHSWDRRFGLKTTKTNKERVIPLAPAVRTRLFEFLRPRGDEDFVFTNPNSSEPLNEGLLLDSFYEVLEKIGIGEVERKARNITFHGYRHYFNTFLRRAGIHDAKVQMVTGHSTSEMTDRYTHFDVRDLAEVAAAQKSILDTRQQDTSRIRKARDVSNREGRVQP